MGSGSCEEEEKGREGGRRGKGEKEKEDKSINLGRGHKGCWRRNDKNASCACVKFSKNKNIFLKIKF